MSESQSHEASTEKAGSAWLEVKEHALGWIAAERPEWWHAKGPHKGKPNAYRIIADTGMYRMTVYRFKDLQGVRGPAPFDADSVALFVALGAHERGVTKGIAFEQIFDVVCPALESVEAAA